MDGKRGKTHQHCPDYVAFRPLLIAKKSSGIKTPQDMNGKKVGLWGPIFQIQPKAFLKRYNLKVKEIRRSYSVNLFLRDGVDVTSAMCSSHL